MTLLWNSHVLFEVILLKRFIIFLELLGLFVVGLNDSSEELLTTSQSWNGTVKEAIELERFVVGRHVVETSKSDVSALLIKLKILYFLLELDKPEINLGSLAIVDTPFDKGWESTQVECLTVWLDDRLELTSQGGELIQRSDCKIHADSGRLVLGHLRDEFSMISHEKFNIDWLSICFVTKKSNDNLKSLGQGSWWVIFEDRVDLFDHSGTNELKLLVAVCLELLRSLVALFLIVKITNSNGSSIIGAFDFFTLSCSFALTLLDLSSILFSGLLKLRDLLINIVANSSGIGPISSLELAVLERSSLSLVTFCDDECKQLLLSHTLKTI